MTPLALLIALLVLAVLFDFLNGFHDSANIVATMIASHAMSARGALLLAAVANLAGPFLLGVAVAHTIGAEVIQPGAMTIAVVLTALASASIWNLATWYFGIPVSTSHALVGGLLGAAVLEAGTAAIQPLGIAKIVVALLLSPLVAFAAALAVMGAARWLLRAATPKANVLLSRAQIVTAAALALGNGANDAQKTVGIIALGLLVLGYTPAFTVPWWSIALSASALSLGTALGGGRIVRTLGSRFYHIRPIHGFAAQLSSAIVILGASLAGGPVSSTQVVSMTIVGAGAAERKSMVRWAILGELLIAWVLTVPASAMLAMPLYLLIRALSRAGG
jgi:PiT family inorganic phosphate transporter